MEPDRPPGGLPDRQGFGSRTSPASAGVATSAVSAVWWLLPILFTWLGGVIAWAMTGDRDPGRARAMLFAGNILAVSCLAISLRLVPGTRRSRRSRHGRQGDGNWPRRPGRRSGQG